MENEKKNCSQPVNRVMFKHIMSVLDDSVHLNHVIKDITGNPPEIIFAASILFT